MDPLRQFWHHFGGLGTLMATLGPQEGYRSEKYIKNTVRGSGVGGHFGVFVGIIFSVRFCHTFWNRLFQACAVLGPKTILKGTRKAANMNQKVTPDGFCAMC